MYLNLARYIDALDISKIFSVHDSMGRLELAVCPKGVAEQAFELNGNTNLEETLQVREDAVKIKKNKVQSRGDQLHFGYSSSNQSGCGVYVLDKDNPGDHIKNLQPQGNEVGFTKKHKENIICFSQTLDYLYFSLVETEYDKKSLAKQSPMPEQVWEVAKKIATKCGLNELKQLLWIWLV